MGMAMQGLIKHLISIDIQMLSHEDFERLHTVAYERCVGNC